MYLKGVLLRRTAMRIRADLVFISSVLFTIALVCLIPAFWANVLTERDKTWLVKLDVGYRLAAQTMSDLSVVCLAIILIGLIVIWTGYVKRARSTWLVMFIIVWVWAFPLLVLPLFKGRIVLTFSEWLYSAIHQPGSPRTWAESVVLFLMMVIALLLPIKSFFLVREIQEPIHRPSPKLIGGSAVTVLLSMVALLAWIHFRVYEIPPDVLSSQQRLPPPPAPPQTPCKVQ
ncbi:MAG: hypothetical protein DMG89_21065 [Acidobacteria bacterium]|nr:MAG: hypothetical protein DMG89_21065 [Acidobacteriota bacterium]